MEQMQYHPVSELFPSMPEGEFQALVADIRANGLRESIQVLGNQIIDGRHRYRACLQAGVEPRFVEVSAEANLNALVISLNLHRRHLSESQRAMVAARLETLDHGQRASPARDANLHVCTRDEAAQMLTVSPRSVAHAAKVQVDGVPELAKAVDCGEIAVSTAADLSRLPADTQRVVLNRTPEEIRAIAREVKDRIHEAGVCGPSAVRIFDQVAKEHELGGIEQIAVVEVIKAEAPILPTPSQAKRIASEGAPGLLVLATDGHYYTAPGDPANAIQYDRWLRLREGLEALGTLDFDVADALAAVPHYQHSNVTRWLGCAVTFLNTFNQIWSQNHA